MVIPKIRRALLAEWDLEETNPGIELRSGYELLYNTTELRYELYKVTARGAVKSDDSLTWQISCPYTGKSITPGMANWLQKYDTSCGGKYDDDDRKKQWRRTFKETMERHAKKKELDKLEMKYSLRGASERVKKYLENSRQVVVPAGAPVGETVQGKKIRPWRPLNGKWS